MIYVDIKHKNETIFLSVYNGIEIGYDKELNSMIPYLKGVENNDDFKKHKNLKS